MLETKSTTKGAKITEESTKDTLKSTSKVAEMNKENSKSTKPERKFTTMTETTTDFPGSLDDYLSLGSGTETSLNTPPTFEGKEISLDNSNSLFYIS